MTWLPFLSRPRDAAEASMLAFAPVSLGIVAALAAGGAALVSGQPWWVVFGAYAGSGLSTMVGLAATYLVACFLAARAARPAAARRS